MAEDEEPGNEITVDDIKKVSEIGPIKALLTPAAELLGQRLKASVEGWLEKKAAENIEEHASAVLPNQSIDDVSDQSQIGLFEWAEKAGRVSSKEAELSASVRAALKATLNGHQDDARILMSLTKPEILYLMDHLPGSVIRSDDGYACNLLEQKALVEKSSMRFGFSRGSSASVRLRSMVFKSVLAVMVLFGSLMYGNLLLQVGNIPEFNGLGIDLSLLMTVFLPIIVTGFAVFFLFWPRRYYLTPKGLEIREKLAAFLAE